MIVEIISKYLETNKRLVVPNLGAFIVKEAGRTVLFSNLIKGDDGVLRSLLISSGVSELEAAAAIDRFVFEVNFRLESRGECMLSGFGELRNGVNGTIAFTFSPSVKGENLDGNISAQKPAVAAQEPVQSVPQPAHQPAHQPAPAPQIEREEENAVEEDVRIDVVPRKETAVRRAEPMAERQRDGRQVRRANPSDDYVKGLRYGKGRKVVTGREGATSRKSQKSDIIMKIAIFAAVLAILALAYGVYNEWRVSHFDEPFISNTEIYEQEPVSAEKEVRNPDLDYITPNGN